MEINRKAHPDCVYAGNPFHECAAACLERIAQGHGKKNTKKQASKIVNFTGSFGRKKKDLSLPQSPLSGKAYSNGGPFANANANSPKVHQSRPSPVVVKKKTVPEVNNNYSSSGEISSERHSLDEYFNRKHDQIPRSPNNLVSPKPGREEQNNRKSDVGVETRVFSFLSPPRSHEKKNNNGYEEDDDENSNNEIGVELDLESVMSDTCVSVGNYRVRSGVSTILRSIIDKQGDIAQNCKLESDSMRSRYLECLCSLMQELRSTPVGQLSKVKVKEMLAVLKDLESVNIDVAWLHSVLEEFAKCQEEVEKEKEKHEEEVKLKRQELEFKESDLVKMEEEVREVKLRIEEIRGEIEEMEMEGSRREKMGFKVEKFKGKTFIDELL